MSTAESIAREHSAADRSGREALELLTYAHDQTDPETAAAFAQQATAEALLTIAHELRALRLTLQEK